MLRQLRIRNLGVIAEASIDLGPGMIALTGETGAGKTMVTSGLGLLLGGRADAGVVRHGSDRALVEGRFEGIEPALVEELGGDLEDGELLVSRQVSHQGRSRAVVGGAQATIGGLGALTSTVATIHGQSEQVRLASSERQRDVLDRFCGSDHLQALAAHQELHQSRRTLQAELDDLVQRSMERAREADLLRHGLEEISGVDPQPGEDSELAVEAARLASLDQLRSLAEEASLQISGSDEGDLEAPGAVGLVGSARRTLSTLADLDATARDLSDRVEEALVLVSDLAADVASYRQDLEADPARFEAVVARQAALAGLTRKYGTTIDEVLAWAEESALRLGELEGSDERIGHLRAEVARLTQELDRSAAGITATRREGAERLAELVTVELSALAMPHARLGFQLDPLPEPGPHGAESVHLVFAANAGSPPQPLGKVASGGELSRVRLALEVILAGDAQGHTFVFDEVDSGIGGAVALEVGRRLARLAQHSQVLVVTHLAQVAAFADQQYVVHKQSDGEVTASGVSLVEGAEREAELARMMGGMDKAEAAREHARELLAEAQSSGGAAPQSRTVARS